MKEYETDDEHDDADRAFFKAHAALLVGAGDLESAAATVTEYALTSGDRGAMAFFWARFADFVEAGKLPPLAMRKGFREAISIALNPPKKAHGAPKLPLLEREWARTNANLVSYFYKGRVLESAEEEVVALRAADIRRKPGCQDLSAPDASKGKIHRDYLQFRKLKK